MWIAICAVVGLIALFLLISALCFFKVFYSRKRKVLRNDKIKLPHGKIYKEFREEITDWIIAARKTTHKDFEIKSYDGLTLRARYYECCQGAPIEIIFHGYRGDAERDMSGGIERCFNMGRNALLVDQRGCGRSDGHVITFGVREHKDCISWINFVIEHFGEDVKIILTGVSMGAATVLMAGGRFLPSNVVCVVADSGYTSAKKIICTILKKKHLPAKLIYPFVKFGARLYGRFKLEEFPPENAVTVTEIPTIFIHGDTDKFVPCSMSEELHSRCSARRKRLLVINNAGHGLAYPCNKTEYIKVLQAIQEECNF